MSSTARHDAGPRLMWSLLDCNRKTAHRSELSCCLLITQRQRLGDTGSPPFNVSTVAASRGGASYVRPPAPDFDLLAVLDLPDDPRQLLDVEGDVAVLVDVVGVEASPFETRFRVNAVLLVIVGEAALGNRRRGFSPCRSTPQTEAQGEDG